MNESYQNFNYHTHTKKRCAGRRKSRAEKEDSFRP